MISDSTTANAARQQSHGSILTIDDEQAVRTSFVLMLEDLGYQPFEAANGLAGLDQIQLQRPDLVLLDLKMPGVSGLETLTRLRQLEPDLPVIVISGTGLVTDVVAALHQGAWDFLLKPIEDLAVLQHTIEKVLERARLKRENLDYQRALEERVAQRTRALEAACQQLATSEQRYRNVFENLQDAYFETSLGGEVLEISPSIVRIIGITAEEILHTNITKRYSDPQLRQKFIAALRAKRQINDFEIEIIAADGHPVPCSVNASLVLDSLGEPLKITGALRDISQRKADENRLRQVNQTLAALFEAAPLAIMAIDTNYQVTLWNRAAEQIFGWTRAEALGMPYPLAPPGKEAEAQLNLARAMAGEQFSGLEVIRQRKDGQLLELSASTAPLCDEQGEIRGLILIAEDISEKHRLRNEADRAARLASLGELAAGVAHEINNPNGLMLLNLPTLREFVADALQLAKGLPAKVPEHKLGGLNLPRATSAFPQLLEELEDGAKRIKQIVEDLKDFARQDSDAPKEPFDLNASVDKALRLAGNHLKKATNHLQRDLQKELPEILGSPQRIEQVIVNLLVNACEALSDREQSIRLQTSFDPDSRQVRLCIQDQGRGIAAENLPHVTDPFFTTRRETGGTGLGLSVSARIIKEHGGQLRFSSQPQQGTTACILLPIAPERTHR